MNHTVGVRPPPPGVIPDFHSQPWLHTANRIAVGVGSTLSTILLIMRIYTKAYILGKFWWDDVLITLAWMLSIGTQATILYGYAHSSFAIHIWNIPLMNIVAYRKTVLALAVIYLPALAFAKLAVLMLYYRLLQSVPAWRYILYCAAAGFSIYSIALVFALIFACHPIQAGWSLSNPSACTNRTGLHLGTAIANTASDVVLILIPIQFMWGMHLPLLQKVGALSLFGIGCLTVVTSIVRLVTLIPFLASPDQTYNIGLVCLFVVIEANFMIVCGSAPYLRPFFRHHAPKETQDRSQRQSSSNEASQPGMRKSSIRTLPDDIEMAINRTPHLADSEYGDTKAANPNLGV